MRLYSPHYKYTMYTTPKSGCTFLGLMFMLLHYKEYEDDELNTQMQKVLDLLDRTKERTGCILLHPEVYAKAVRNSTKMVGRPRQEKNLEEKHRFLVTRNPYSRAVSMYVDKYCYLEEKRSDKWGKAKLDKNLTFLKFLDQVRDRGGLRKSHHYQTQCYHINKNKHFRVDDITTLSKLKIEDKDEGLLSHYKTYVPDLDQSILLNAIVESKKIPNRSPYGTETKYSSRIIFYNKPLTHTKDSFLTRSAKRKIYKMYEEDFLKLGYTK